MSFRSRERRNASVRLCHHKQDAAGRGRLFGTALAHLSLFGRHDLFAVTFVLLKRRDRFSLAGFSFGRFLAL